MKLVSVTKIFWGGLKLAGAVALIAYLAFQVWSCLGPTKPQLSHLRRQVAAQLLPQMVEDLRKSKDAISSAVLFHLNNDPTDYVTDQLRLLIEQSGILDLRDRSLAEKVQKQLNLRVTSVETLDAALARARGQGVEGLIFGRVNTFESYEEGAKLDLEITLASVADRKVVFNRQYHRGLQAGLLNEAVVRDGIARINGPQRFFGWVLAALLLPVFTISFIRAMVRKETNHANAFTLAIYTGVDAVLAYLLLAGGLNTWWSWTCFLALVGAALAYNLFLMNLALKMEQ